MTHVVAFLWDSVDQGKSLIRRLRLLGIDYQVKIDHELGAVIIWDGP